MANVVTVIGVGGEIINLPFECVDTAKLAQSLADVINAEVKSGNLTPVEPVGPVAPTLSPGQLGELILKDPGSEILTAGYKAIIVKANNETIIGKGETNQSVLASGSALNFITGGGSGTIAANGNASQIITSATGPAGWLVKLCTGDNTVNSQSGNDTIEAGDGRNTVFLGTGNNFVGVTGQDSITTGSGSDTISVSDRNGLAGGNPNASAYVQGGSGKLLFIANHSDNTVLGGSGSATIYGGSGKDYFQGGAAGHNLIYGGAGGGTLVGGGNADTIFATGLGNTTIVAGTGNETIGAAGGTDLFKIINGAAGGNDLILGFSGADSVSLSGYGAGEAQNALNSAQHTAGGIVVTLSDNTKITFAGVNDTNNLHFG